MIKKGIIRLGQVVFVYSKPPEKALVGLVDSIDYPILTITTVPRDGKNKFGKMEKIDLSKDVPLTIMTDNNIKECLTPKERKRLKKKQKDSEIVDLFSGTY